MYNWKLSALFIIGLMLVIGVFSNAAMAAPNDGEGAVAAAWGFQSDPTSPAISPVSSTDTPLNAGSTHNILQFTYEAAENNQGINMAGGRVRISFPTGWKVSNKLIRVNDSTDIGPDGDGVVYETDGEGNLIETNSTGFNTSDKKTDANAKVTFEADRHITVNLGSEWSSANNSNGSRHLIIILADVTAPIPSRLTEDAGSPADYSDDYANIPFQCSSSAKNGTLIRLSDSVEVKVGNILGDRDFSLTTEYSGRDPLIREVKVTPARVFIGDTNISVQIVFEASWADVRHHPRPYYSRGT